KRAYCLKTQPATGETYPKSDLFNKANQMLIIISQRLMVGAFSHDDMVWLRAQFNAPNLNESDISNVLAALSLVRRAR
ncbi:hypothetical protein R5L04_14860, partial [Salmonella enterica subsp. enterica]